MANTGKTDRGLLLYMAIGDAYGMGYEFVDDYSLSGPNDLTYKSHPKFTAYQKGHYTDDTQMALANAELLVGRYPRLEAPDYADAYVNAFRRDPRPGYTSFLFNTLSGVQGGAALSRAIDPTRSTASGAAMRAAPFGLLPEIDKVKELAAAQAKTTHNNKTGILSAQIAALAVHYMYYYHGAKRDLPDFLDNNLGKEWQELIEQNGPKDGLYIVGKALQAVMAKDKLSELLKGCIDMGPGQDTDTIAAIAMAIASQCREYEDDLPQTLFDELESGAYGGGYLRYVDEKLQTRFERPPAPPPPPPPAPIDHSFDFFI